MVTIFSKPSHVSVSPLFIIPPLILRDITILSIKKDLDTPLYETKNSWRKVKLLFACPLEASSVHCL